MIVEGHGKSARQTKAISGLDKKTNEDLLWFVSLIKDITKRPQKSSFRRPIRDGKYHVGKCSAKLVFKSLPEIESCAVPIIAEGATGPCGERSTNISRDAQLSSPGYGDLH